MKKIRIVLLLVAGLLAMSCDAQPPSAKSPVNKGTRALEDSELASRYARFSKAYFAGGCFWCTEAVYERVKGVEAVYSGYCGGHVKNPTYEQVGSDRTGHAESIVIFYDPQQVSYERLLEVFFATHDPTTLNRQGPDVGTAYRSAIFYLSEDQKQAAESYIAKLAEEGRFKAPIVTEVKPASTFWLAEDYHQDYYELNPDNPYIQRISKPKVEKFNRQFPELRKQ